MQVEIVGHLYITDKNTCFNAEHVRFAIPFSDVQKIAKQPGLFFQRNENLHIYRRAVSHASQCR